jgi:3-phenylpropionate/cinnamic acid dioxygenase small subunit
VRTVSRFVVTGEDESHIELRAAMVLVEYKYERTRVLAADVTYRLVREGADLKLDRKIVRLANCDDFLHGIGYLL